MNTPANRPANGTTVEQIRNDYSHFPYDQSYELYAEDVYFKDPLNEFRGVKRYQWMISLLQNLFHQHQLDLHDISQPQADQILTRWTLSMTAPLPWQPRLSISGHSELGLNEQGLVVSHIDYWNCSRWDVFQQIWRSR
ncbi:MAG: DUF2358 domain-containing protein [Cyanobacteria bacterium J06632_22]